jgi:hypothetical protein
MIENDRITQRRFIVYGGAATGLVALAACTPGWSEPSHSPAPPVNHRASSDDSLVASSIG